MSSNAPSFEALEQEIRREARGDIRRVGRAERVALVLALLGLAIALVSLWLPATTVTAVAAHCGIVVEMLAISVYAFLSLKREITTLADARRDFALDLDRNYPGYLHVLAWLRRVPKNDIRERLDYLRMRQSSMARRMGLLIGSAERFGMLPVAIALYLQLKSMTWPPSYSVWETLVAFALVMFYAMSYFVMATKMRLDLYVILLEASLAKTP
jgi:hypothetical protein